TGIRPDADAASPARDGRQTRVRHGSGIAGPVVAAVRRAIPGERHDAQPAARPRGAGPPGAARGGPTRGDRPRNSADADLRGTDVRGGGRSLADPPTRRPQAPRPGAAAAASRL